MTEADLMKAIEAIERVGSGRAFGPTLTLQQYRRCRRGEHGPIVLGLCAHCWTDVTRTETVR